MARCARRQATLAIIAALLALANPAVAQPNSIEQFVAAGRFDEARQLVARLTADSPAAALHFAFVEGLIRIKQGELDDAVRIFRAILSAEPNFEPARVELARALLAQGHTDAAKYHFTALEKGSREREVRQLATRHLAHIRANRTHGFSGYVSLLPSTNVNSGTANSQFIAGNLTFDINDDSRAHSGVGLATGGSAFRRFKLGDQTSLTVTGTIDARKYLNTTDYDQLTVGSSAIAEFSFGRATLFGGFIADYRLLAWKPDQFRYGITAGFSRPIGTRNEISAAVTARVQDYLQTDYRDGFRIDTSLTFRRLLSPSISFAATFGTSFERTQKTHLDHNDVSASVTFAKEWRGGFITGISAAIGNHQYQGLFPASTQKRHDQLYSAGITLAHRSFAIAGFMPKLTYRYTRQVSNIAFYDYDSHDVGLTLTREF